MNARASKTTSPSITKIPNNLIYLITHTKAFVHPHKAVDKTRRIARGWKGCLTAKARLIIPWIYLPKDILPLPPVPLPNPFFIIPPPLKTSVWLLLQFTYGTLFLYAVEVFEWTEWIESEWSRLSWKIGMVLLCVCVCVNENLCVKDCSCVCVCVVLFCFFLWIEEWYSIVWVYFCLLCQWLLNVS